MASDTFTSEEISSEDLSTDKEKSRDLGRFHIEKVMMSKFKVVSEDSPYQGCILVPWWGDLHSMDNHTDTDKNVINLKVFRDGTWNGQEMASLSHRSIIKNVKAGKLTILS